MDADLLESLPPLERLALSYAPAVAREKWLTLLAFDSRLATVIRQAKEPVLAQLRLAWWRDRLGQSRTERPRGEPLLARLEPWEDAGQRLVALVDGWEALLAEPPLTEAAMHDFAEGKVRALTALASQLGVAPGAVEASARRWAFADLALHLGAADARTAAVRLLADVPVDGALPRAMRPLAVLEQVTVRAARKGSRSALTSPMVLPVALRAGLLGR